MKPPTKLVAESVSFSPNDETLTRSAPSLIVISPAGDDPHEAAILGELFAAGLARYHVRKPHWSRGKLAAWLQPLPGEWRSRIVVHQHHELAEPLALGGLHLRDGVGRGVPAEPSRASPRINHSFSEHAAAPTARRAASPHLSRSCHDLPTLRAALGHYDSIFFSPVFPSVSKPGHGPRADITHEDLSLLLASRTPVERRTAVLALGGITAETARRALALGFDGVAVLGAVWHAPDPVRAYHELRNVAAASCRPSFAGAGGKPALLRTSHA